MRPAALSTSLSSACALQGTCNRLARTSLTYIESNFLNSDDGTGEGGDATGGTCQAALDQLWVKLCHADACTVTLQGIALCKTRSQPARIAPHQLCSRRAGALPGG